MDKGDILIVLFVVLLIVGGIWWLPQKWEACTRLYDNVPAQIICFNQR